MEEEIKQQKHYILEISEENSSSSFRLSTSPRCQRLTTPVKYCPSQCDSHVINSAAALLYGDSQKMSAYPFHKWTVNPYLFDQRIYQYIKPTFYLLPLDSNTVEGIQNKSCPGKSLGALGTHQTIDNPEHTW